MSAENELILPEPFSAGSHLFSLFFFGVGFILNNIRRLLLFTMKIHRISSPIVLFLLPAIWTTVAAQSLPTEFTTLVPRGATDPNDVVSNLEVLASPKAVPRGTLDAPIDGKDGKPHAGPWVETSAERDRKKAKEENSPEGNSKFESKVSSLERLGPDGEAIPDSNDGVMDDPDRVAPKEGTRGTEGGVSEKQKESRLSKEKVPDGPKEAPPLPQSERQKLPVADEGVDQKETKGSDVSDTLGVLEVLPRKYYIGTVFLGFATDDTFRNRMICQKSPTISQFQSLQRRGIKTLSASIPSGLLRSHPQLLLKSPQIMTPSTLLSSRLP